MIYIMYIFDVDAFMFCLVYYRRHYLHMPKMKRNEVLL